MSEVALEEFETDHHARFVRIDDAFVAGSATVVGNVKLGARASVWFGTVIRGDDAPITVGERTNIQDLTMVHADPGVPLVIEDDVLIGHRAIVHCSRIETGALIGMGSVLLSGVVVGAGSLVAAGAVVSPGTIIPPNTLVRGVPARVVRETTPEERAGVLRANEEYARKAEIYTHRSGDVDV